MCLILQDVCVYCSVKCGSCRWLSPGRTRQRQTGERICHTPLYTHTHTDRKRDREREDERKGVKIPTGIAQRQQLLLTYTSFSRRLLPSIFNLYPLCRVHTVCISLSEYNSQSATFSNNNNHVSEFMLKRVTTTFTFDIWVIQQTLLYTQSCLQNVYGRTRECVCVRIQACDFFLNRKVSFSQAYTLSHILSSIKVTNTAF